MAPHYPGTEGGVFAKPYVNGIYIPCGLLLVGCAIIKAEWLSYAAGLVILLGAWKFYDMRNSQWPFQFLGWPRS